jgi:ribosomal protein S18 acetylase RimI-like enzyme
MLTPKQLLEIRELQNKCEIEDGLMLKLNWDMLNSRSSNEKTDFLHYVNTKLVGFIGIYGFGNKVEVCGMVDPEFRRRGIFTKLFKEALMEIKERQFRKILINAPGNSETAKGLLHSIPCKFDITEYQMRCTEILANPELDEIKVRIATPEDFDKEIQIEVECFGFEKEDAIDFYHQVRREGRDFYVIEYHGDVVGKMRVSYFKGEAWIFGFGILPKFQGRGIGRKVLSYIVSNELKNGYNVVLEVEAKNDHALRLYESCGFRKYSSQDYFDYKLSLGE